MIRPGKLYNIAMKIRVISDIHRSINSSFPISLEDNCDYTLIAGDLGPEHRKNAKWLLENVRRGAFISGNHDAYNRDVTIDQVKSYYHRKFPVDSDVTYFDSSVGVVSKEISTGILLVADVMYTDYALPICNSDEGLPEDIVVKRNIRRAEPKFHGMYMNDFNYFTKSSKYATEWEMSQFEGKKRYHIRPQHYMDHFKKAFGKIERAVESNPDKEIILMTHHCLSPRCISEKFSKDELNASYVSDREKWIADHENIKLVVSGHVHHRADFHVGNALYVLNPLGYVPYGENMEGENGCAWTPNCFVDTDTWTLEREPWDDSPWRERQECFSKAMAAFL